MPRGRPKLPLPPYPKPAPPRGPKLPAPAPPPRKDVADELIHTDKWFFDPDYPCQFRVDPAKQIPGVLHAYGYTYVAKYHAWYHYGNLAPPPYWSMAWIDKNLDVPVVEPYVLNGIQAWMYFRMRLRSLWDVNNSHSIGQMLFMMQRRRRLMEYLLEYEHALHHDLRLPFPIRDDDDAIYAAWKYDPKFENEAVLSCDPLALQPLITLDNSGPTILNPRIGKGQARVRYVMTRQEQLQRIEANPSAVAHDDLTPEERCHQGDWYYAIREYKWRGETHGFVDNQPPPFTLPSPLDPSFVPRPGAYRIAPVRSKYLPWKFHDDPRPRSLPWGSGKGNKLEQPEGGGAEAQAVHRQVRPIEERWEAPIMLGPLPETANDEAVARVEADPLPHVPEPEPEAEEGIIFLDELQPATLFEPTVVEPHAYDQTIPEPTLAPSPPLPTGSVPHTWPHQTESRWLALFREVAEQHYRLVPEFTAGDHAAIDTLEDYAKDIAKGENLDSIFIAPAEYIQSLSGRGAEFVLREWFTSFVKRNSGSVRPLDIIAKGVAPPD